MFKDVVDFLVDLSTPKNIGSWKGGSVKGGEGVKMQLTVKKNI